MLRLILVHISGPRKDKGSCPVFVFRRVTSNAICDLVLYLLKHIIDLSWYNPVPFRYLKTVVAMQCSTVSETGRHFIFLKWAAPMWERGGKSKQRDMHLYCAVWSLCFRFLLSMGNHDVQPQSKWGWIKSLHSNLFNRSIKYLFCQQTNWIFALTDFFQNFHFHRFASEIRVKVTDTLNIL